MRAIGYSRVFIFFLLAFNSSLVFCQRFYIDEGKFYIEILGTEVTSFNASNTTRSKSKTLKTVHIRLKMATTDGEYALFDINKFSLIDESNKLRIRPIDVAHRMVMRELSFPRLATRPLEKPHPEVSEDISVVDSFYESEFDGYEIIETPLAFGNLFKSQSQVTYFRPGTYRSKKLDFYFPFPKSSSIGVLYYGEEKVAIVVFK
jgi:hypothetical protein